MCGVGEPGLGRRSRRGFGGTRDRAVDRRDETSPQTIVPGGRSRRRARTESAGAEPTTHCLARASRDPSCRPRGAVRGPRRRARRAPEACPHGRRGGPRPPDRAAPRPLLARRRAGVRGACRRRAACVRRAHASPFARDRTARTLPCRRIARRDGHPPARRARAPTRPCPSRRRAHPRRRRGAPSPRAARAARSASVASCVRPSPAPSGSVFRSRHAGHPVP